MINNPLLFPFFSLALKRLRFFGLFFSFEFYPIKKGSVLEGLREKIEKRIPKF